MIDVKNLSKDYLIKRKGAGLSGALKGLVTRNTDVIHAVKDLSFHIDEGEIVGFIGPNGAGKSTTIKMMSGILTPTSGSVLIDGEDITKHRKEVVRNIGVVFGQRTQLNWDLRLGETFELLKHIYRIRQTDYDKTLDVMNGVLTVDRAQIASYAGETLPSTWISDRDVYSAGATPTTGAQVVYELATHVTYHLTSQEITTLLGQNNIWADTGDTSVTYRADTKLYIDNKITQAIANALNS